MKFISAIAALILLSTLLSGCGEVSASVKDNSSSAVTSSSSEITATNAATTATNAGIVFEKDDYYYDWKADKYEEIVLTTENISITKSGTYVLSGVLSEGSININVNKDTDKGTVVLVLNGASISSNTTAPIYVAEAKKVLLILENDTENTVFQGSGVTPNADSEPSSAIFSKADMTITGGGKLLVTSEYNDGICSKDSLYITGGIIDVTAKNSGDGIVGKDTLCIGGDAEITMDVGKKGLRSTNEIENGSVTIYGGKLDITAVDDAINAVGDVNIYGGSLTLNSGNDAAHSDKKLTVNGGSINIESSLEGLEGANITISGGNTSIISSDDGINVNQNSGTLLISGGETFVNASGDGLDSNSTVEITGGVTYVDGPSSGANGALDAERAFTISGGTLVASSSSAMLQAPTTSIPAATMYYNSAQAAGTTASLRDESGNIILSITPQKQYDAVIFISSELTSGSTYSIYSNDTETVSVEFTNEMIYLDENGITQAKGGFGGGHGGMGGMGGMGGGKGQGAAPSFDGTPPESGDFGQAPPDGTRPERPDSTSSSTSSNVT